MSNPFFDINDILGRQMNADLAQHALDMFKSPSIKDSLRANATEIIGVPDTADLIDYTGIGNLSSQMVRLMDIYRPEIFNSLTRGIDFKKVVQPNWITPTLHPELAKELEQPYWVHQGALKGINTGYITEAVAALGKDLPRADLSTQIAELMNGYQVIPDDLVHSLSVKIGVLNPKSWEMAYDLVEAESTVRETVERFVKEKPDEVEEIVSSVTGRSPDALPSMSGRQLAGVFKDLLGAAGAVAGALSGSVTVAVIIFILVVTLSSVETELENEEKKSS